MVNICMSQLKQEFPGGTTNYDQKSNRGDYFWEICSTFVTALTIHKVQLERSEFCIRDTRTCVELDGETEIDRVPGSWDNSIFHHLRSHFETCRAIIL